MKINLNARVRVKLTGKGETILMMDDRVFRDLRPDGYDYFLMWELMQIFGPALHMGAVELPFEDNIIEVMS